MEQVLHPLGKFFRGFKPQQFAMELEDLCQDLWLRLASRCRKEPCADSYVQRAAQNVAIDSYRRFRARGGAALAIDQVEETQFPSAGADQETALLLKQVILGLPPIYRDVFILNRFVGLTYEQIAERLGITTKAVEYRMSRALALCQAALRDD